MSEPTADANDDRPGGSTPEDPGPSRPPEPPGAALIGPAFGILLGFLVLRLLPSSTAFWLRVLIAVVVIAVVTYATLEITRWRARR
ncbi:MAG: hypothetical protein ACXWYE_04020 [Actinomycetota bacterium]